MTVVMCCTSSSGKLWSTRIRRPTKVFDFLFAKETRTSEMAACEYSFLINSSTKESRYPITKKKKKMTAPRKEIQDSVRVCINNLKRLKSLSRTRSGYHFRNSEYFKLNVQIHSSTYNKSIVFRIRW